jgi:hypothetical protein
MLGVIVGAKLIWGAAIESVGANSMLGVIVGAKLILGAGF